MAFTPRPAPPLPEALSALPKFEKAKKFLGVKPGYMFTSGQAGVGYYIDRVQIGKMGDKAKARLAASASGSASGGATFTSPRKESSVTNATAGMPGPEADSTSQNKQTKKAKKEKSKAATTAAAAVPQQQAKPDGAAAAAVAAAKRKGAGGVSGNGVLTSKGDDGSPAEEEEEEAGGSDSDADSDMDDEGEEEDAEGEGGTKSTEKANGVAADREQVGGRARNTDGDNNVSNEEGEDVEGGHEEEGDEEEQQQQETDSEDDGDGMEAAKRVEVRLSKLQDTANEAAVALKNEDGRDGGALASESGEVDSQEDEDEDDTGTGNKPDGTTSPGDIEADEEPLGGGQEGGQQDEDEKVSFQSLGVTGPLCEAAGQLGWTHATEIQRQALPLAFQARVTKRTNERQIRSTVQSVRPPR